MNRARLFWSAIVGVILIVATFGPWLVPYNPMRADPSERFSAPGSMHWLGTDQFGRDVLSRTLAGARTTLPTALGATAIAVILGAVIGLIAAGLGGWIEWALMRIVEILLVLPGLLLAMVLVALLGAGPWALTLGVGISLAPGFSRLVRAAALTVLHESFIEAARALGASPAQVIIRHLLPNVLADVIAFTVVLYGWSLLNIAALEFLGLAGSVSTPRWGSMLFEGREYLRVAPWIALAPGSMLTLSVLAVTHLSDAWRSQLGV